jgi:galactose mutarotase-like enzyme
VTARVSTDWSFNGVQALVLENGRLRVVVLPELGGKVWQVTDLRTGRDLLWQNPRLTARPVPFGSSYDDQFFGGWDELFPNDLAEEIAGEPYPDHGELWAAPWQWHIEEQGPEQVRVTLSLATAISACRITKTLTLAAGEPRLRLSWRIENESGQELPYLWKQHVAVPVTEPATLSMGARSMYVEGFGNPRAGGEGSRYEWPHLVDDAGESHDMRPTLPPDSRVAEFQYATELDDGWCAVTYADGSGIGLAFDDQVFRSCWTFASYGGWRAHEVLVLEPCTGYPVSVNDGIAADTHQVLPAGGALETELVMVAYEAMADVTGIDRDGCLQGSRLTDGAHS